MQELLSILAFCIFILVPIILVIYLVIKLLRRL